MPTPTAADQISFPVKASSATQISRFAPSRSRFIWVNALPSAIVKELKPFLIGTFQRTFGPLAGQLRFGVSAQMPSPLGPRYSGQSEQNEQYELTLRKPINVQMLFIV